MGVSNLVRLRRTRAVYPQESASDGEKDPFADANYFQAVFLPSPLPQWVHPLDHRWPPARGILKLFRQWPGGKPLS